MSHPCDLHKAFEEKSQEKFIEALEVFEVDPNATVDGESRTLFERILSTPDSAWYIKKCIEYGADFNVVSNFFFWGFLCTLPKCSVLVRSQGGGGDLGDKSPLVKNSSIC